MTPTNSISSIPRKSTRCKRHVPGVMNGVETAYAEHLAMEVRQGMVAEFHFEGLKLRIGSNCHYTPDFTVIGYDGQVTFVEVKSWWKASKKKRMMDSNAKGRVGWMDDARVKIKVAASTYPYFRFKATWLVDGKWEEETFDP